MSQALCSEQGGALPDKVAEKIVDTQLAHASWEPSTHCAPGPKLLSPFMLDGLSQDIPMVRPSVRGRPSLSVCGVRMEIDIYGAWGSWPGCV